MKPTRGCSSGGTEGEGPQGLPGLLISIAFAFLFVSIFLPGWTINSFLLCFVAVEAGAAVLYLVGDHRSRADPDRLRRELHQTNTKTDH